MSDSTSARDCSLIAKQIADRSSLEIPRVDCALYIMDMSIELSHMADEAGLPEVIGLSLKKAARAAQDRARELDPNCLDIEA